MPTGVHPPGEREILPLRADGLGTWGRVADPGEVVRSTRPAHGAGRFHIVSAGSFRLGSAVLPKFGCVHQAPQETPPFEFDALEARSELIVVQFPAQALLNEARPERRAAPKEYAAP